MRTINNIVLHCTATPQNAKIENIKKYWKEVLKWKSPGYHWIIKADGTAVQLLPIEEVSNGVAGHNKNSVHISYIGGIDDFGHALDNRTDAQKQKQIYLINKLRELFPLARIRGHRDFPNVQKSCPSFDARQWCLSVGIDPDPPK